MSDAPEGYRNTMDPSEILEVSGAVAARYASRASGLDQMLGNLGYGESERDAQLREFYTAIATQALVNVVTDVDTNESFVTGALDQLMSKDAVQRVTGATGEELTEEGTRIVGLFRAVMQPVVEQLVDEDDPGAVVNMINGARLISVAEDRPMADLFANDEQYKELQRRQYGTPANHFGAMMGGARKFKDAISGEALQRKVIEAFVSHDDPELDDYRIAEEADYIERAVPDELGLVAAAARIPDPESSIHIIDQFALEVRRLWGLDGVQQLDEGIVSRLQDHNSLALARTKADIIAAYCEKKGYKHPSEIGFADRLEITTDPEFKQAPDTI